MMKFSSKSPRRESADNEQGALGPSPKTFRDITVAVFRQPAGLVGFTVTVAIVLIAVLAPLVAPYSPIATDTSNILAGPSGHHLLGTDEIGRDVLSRLIFGARPALIVGALAALVGGSLGIALGVIAGYRRGIAESIIMRASDVVFAFPLVLIGIAAVLVLGAGVFSVGIAVGIGVAPMFARLARAQVMTEVGLDHVKAARGMGATGGWVVRRHILPNLASVVVVQMAVTISGSVVMASGLDFLGLGTQAPAPSWGNMLEGSREYLADNPVYAISPGVMLTVFVLSVNLFGAALTNALKPQLRTKILRSRGLLTRARSQGIAPTNGVLELETTAVREES